MESNGGQAHASSSSHSSRSSSPIRGDSRGFRAVCSEVQHKLREFYTFDLMPKTFTLKFRQRVEGLQLDSPTNQEFGPSSERICDHDSKRRLVLKKFNGVQVDGMHLQRCKTDDCHTKLVIKPYSGSGYWRVICEPKQRDLRILTKKIPVGSLLHFQFGIGHDFIRNSTGWKWKVTSALGLPGLSAVRQKIKFPIFPGFDLDVDWNAQYELPELHGSSGTGEPAIEANIGHLHAQIERVSAVYTHVG